MPSDASTGDIVNPQTGEVLPAVLTFEQAYQTYKNFVTDNRERNNKNAAIARKINGEQPWNPRKLRSAGQAWRSNRPTGFMSSLIKRITPPYKQVVDQLPLLTYSRFEDQKLGTESSQDVFRRAVTDCIRHWDGWSDFMSQLVDEDIGYGYAAIGYEDEFTWKPKMHRSDEAMFYVGCPQLASNVKIWALKEDFFVDDIVEILRNPEVSADAGWRTDNLAKKLNTSSKQFDDKANEENTRVYEDLIRENNLASSFTSSIRVVKAGHVFALNPEGGVDHYIFDRDDGVPLFYRKSRYAKMENCLVLFTAEVGDRTLHGSRGAGRALYNTHVSVEQARNLIQDALHLSGLLLLRKTQKAGVGSLDTPGLSVNHPFAIVGEGYEVLENVRFEINSEAFFALDRHATMQAEIQIGAFMPGQIMDDKGQRRTASEVNYVASIDAQIRAGMLARFADQVFALIDQMQRRICRPLVVQYAMQVNEQIVNSGKIPVFDVELWNSLVESGTEGEFFYTELPSYVDHDALRCVLKMIQEGLTPTQIVILSNSSSRANVDDAIASQSGVLDLIVSKYASDPIIDTVELKRRDIASKLGASAAERLMNVDLSPMSILRQQRQQLIELTSMMAGQPMPIDPTDDDKAHLDALVSRVAPMLDQLEEIPLDSSRQFLELAMQHADQHFEAAVQKGIRPSELSELKAIFDDARQLLAAPTTESQAQQVVESAASAGAIPATEVAQVASAASAASPGFTPTQPMAEEAVPSSVIESVANPPRPTPPRA
jgi:hypothetical protein